MTNDRVLHIEPDLGAPMTVRVSAPGDRFDKTREPHCASDLLVEFYDDSYARAPGFTAFGQYIDCRCADQVLAHAADRLILSALVPQWSIDAKTLENVQNWLRQTLD